MLHFSRRTEGAYFGWIHRFVRHSGVLSADDLSEETVRSFLIHVADVRRVSPATQALPAVLLLFREVLRRPLGGVGPVPRARVPSRLPVVLTTAEVERVIAHLSGTARLVGRLRYGRGSVCSSV